MIASIVATPPVASVFTGSAQSLAPLASGAAVSTAGVAAVGTAASTAAQVGVALRDRNDRPSGATGLASLLDQSLIRDRVASFRAGERAAQGDAVTNQRAESRRVEDTRRDTDARELARDAAEVLNAAVTLAQQARQQAANEASFTPPAGPSQEAIDIASTVEAAEAADRTTASQAEDNAVNSVVRPDSNRLGLEAAEDARSASPIVLATISAAAPGANALGTDRPATAVTATSGSLLAAVPTQDQLDRARAAGPQSAQARAAALFSEVDRIAQTSGQAENRAAASPRIRASA